MFYTRNFILTQAANPVEVRADGGFSKQYAIEPIETVSTIGAGDNFNAGFLYGLLLNGITRQQLEQGLSAQQWDSLIHCAMQFSAEACKSLYNYVSPEFGAQKMRK
jgi:fructokinase